MPKASPPEPLHLRGCAFTALSTGEEAASLRELRDRILRIPVTSLYYHFWGRLLRPVPRDQDYVNDFANRVGHELRDPLLAERLALVDPGDRTDLETLRVRVADLLETRLSERAGNVEVVRDEAFHFLEGQMVIYDTGARARDPVELGRMLPDLPPSTVYYHVIDARHRPPAGVDDFQMWLEAWGEPCRELVEALRTLDVYFTSLPALHVEVADLFREHVGGIAS